MSGSSETRRPGSGGNRGVKRFAQCSVRLAESSAMPRRVLSRRLIRNQNIRAAMKKPAPIPLGAQLISLEIAMVSLLQVIARTQPAAVQRVVATMRDIASLVPEKHFPGVSEKVEQYAETIEAEMTESNESTASSALFAHQGKSVVQ